MDVKFDLNRNGKFRTDTTSEIILKQNVDILKNDVRTFLKNLNSEIAHDKIEMTIIIPSKGHNIKIDFENINDKILKKELRKQFPNSIYNGDYSEFEKNLFNEYFPIHVLNRNHE